MGGLFRCGARPIGGSVGLGKMGWTGAYECDYITFLVAKASRTMKKFLLSLILMLIPSSAWACSCVPWEGGYVSEFVQNYTSIWGVPIHAKLSIKEKGSWGEQVAYEILVLDDFNRGLGETMTIMSSPADGGSCGIQLKLGVPQFLSAHKYDVSRHAVGSCTPDLPYESLITFLKTGENAFIPARSDCTIWRKELGLDYKIPYPDTSKPECSVWSLDDLSLYDNNKGSEDLRKYYGVYRNRTTEKKP